MLHVDMAAYEDVLQMQRQMQELANDFAEQIRPAMEVAKSIASSAGIQAAMRLAAEQAEIFSRIEKEQAEHWSRVLQAVNPGPFFATSLRNEVHPSARTDATRVETVEQEADENEKDPEQLIIDEIANKATELLEDSVTKLQEDRSLVHLLLTEDRYLRNEDVPGAQKKLSRQMCLLIKALELKYVSTPILTQKSGYKNDEVTRRAMQKLNRFAFHVLKMPVSIAIGEQGDGYRFPRCIRIRRLWSELPQ